MSATETVISSGREIRLPIGGFQKQGMTCFQIDPLQDSRWKTLIDEHPDASVFHRVEWLQALHSCYGYVPVALSYGPPGGPLQNGLVYCEIRSRLTGNRLVSLPFSDHCEPLLSNRGESDLLMAGLTEKTNKPWKSLEIRPISHAPNEQKDMAVSQSYYSHRIDLRHSAEALFKRFHKDSIQRKIRRAERESLRYEEGSSDQLLTHFYKLLIMTRRRQGLPPQPLKWFRSLIATMAKDLKIRVALKGQIPVASILTITYKKTMVYKYGCSDRRFNNLGGTALLFWKAIQDAKADGIEEFDMGRSSQDNTGLITFKDHWGAQRSTINYWRYPAEAATFHPEGLIRHAKTLISIAPDSFLAMLGRLLYGHIG